MAKRITLLFVFAALLLATAAVALLLWRARSESLAGEGLSFIYNAARFGRCR